MARKGFDVAAFIRGVQRPTRSVTLCTDGGQGDRLAALAAEVERLGAAERDADQPLMGNPRLDEARAELAALEQDATWAEFVVQAPTHQDKIDYMAAMALTSAVERDPEVSDEAAGRARGGLLDAESVLIAKCLTSINGEPVEISGDDARYILTEWPDSLTRELIDAINDLSGPVVTAPFSRRASANQTTSTP